MAREVSSALALGFSEASLQPKAFETEYLRSSQSDDDPIGQWLKLAKAKGDTSESDPLLINLVVELHRKVDALECLIKNEEPERLQLSQQATIIGIDFDAFVIDASLFHSQTLYYGRIAMPTYPKRDVALFFEATDTTHAQIKRMHERDEKDWSAYVTARERAMIREKKGLH